MQVLQSHGTPANGTSEVQTFTIGGTPDGGTFTLTFGSMVTAPITWSATTGTILSRINAALDAILGTGACVATAGTISSGIGTVLLTFSATRAKQLQPFTLSAASSLTGSSPTVAVAVTTPGVTATQRGAAIGALCIDIDATPPVLYMNTGTVIGSPNWAAVSVTLGGVASVAAGGTGVATLTSHGLLVGQGTSAAHITSAGTAGQVMVSGGAGADPDWSNAPTLSTPTFTGLPVYSVANALTAHAGGGQASALALTKSINRITTVGTAADSVKLPAATAGAMVTVINAAASNAMNVYPASGEAINALTADTALSVAANKTITFFCAVAGTWNSALTA